MIYLVDMEHPGLVVFPTHRLVRDLPDFNVEKFDSIVGLMSLMSYTNHYHGNTEEKNDKYV
jgi:hypothetical protein